MRIVSTLYLQDWSAPAISTKQRAVYDGNVFSRKLRLCVINFSQLARNINCIEITSLSGLRWRSVCFLLINEEDKLKTQVDAT